MQHTYVHVFLYAKQKHPGCKKSVRPIRSSIANINKGGQVIKSIIVVTICYKLLCHSSRFLISNFLASTDIKVFGRTYLFAMLVLIGLTLFYTQGVFV